MDWTHLRQQDALVLAVRDGKLWHQNTDLGSLLLAGNQIQTMAWSAESLFGISIDTLTVAKLHLRRWDRALLAPSSTPVDAREDLIISLTELPASASLYNQIPSLDFPAAGGIGLAMVPYYVLTDADSVVYATNLYWVERSPLQVVDQTSIPGLAFDCRMSGARAVCVSREQMFFVERSSTSQGAMVHQIDLPKPDSTNSGLLAFDGQTAYLSEHHALRAIAFDCTTDQAAAAPTIKFSHYPLTVTEVPGALVVASNHELVTLTPQCAPPRRSLAH